MKKPQDIGTNRTGVKASPIDSASLIKAAEEAHTGGAVDGRALETERLTWATSAEPIGSVPPPGSVKGVVKTLLEKAQGHKPTVFIDKLAERIAFERTGTRLYEALIVKYEAASVHEGGPTREDLERIRNDEHRHFLMVRDAMEYVGGDPTAMTPSADIVAVSGLGWVQVLADPRTTLTQCLDVILMAELSDNDGWALLINLADGLGFDDLARQFRTALVEEEDHLLRVRTWINNALLGQAGVAPTPPQPESTPAA